MTIRISTHGFGILPAAMQRRRTQLALHIACASARHRPVGWRPITFVWRRRRTTRKGAPLGHSAPSGLACWTSHLHLHFTTFLSGQRRTVARLISSHLLSVRAGPGRVVHGASMPRMQIRDTVIPPRTRLASGPPRAVHISHEIRWWDIPPMNCGRQRSSRHTVPGLGVHFHAHDGSTRTVRPISSIAVTEPHVRFTISTRVYQPRRPHQRSADDTHSLLTHSRFTRGSPHWQLHHPATLVWRRETEPDGAPNSHARRSHVDWSAPHSSARPLVIDQRVTTSRLATTLPHAQQQATVDQPTLDRLADDVIRRVERRARIDRERRGL